MLNTISYKEKEIRAMQRELNRLYAAKWNLGLYELEKPIRHGWYKYLKLRNDIARRKDAQVFQSVIDVAGMKVWGKNKKHADLVWTKENSKAEYVEFPGIQKLGEKKYMSLMPVARKYFEGIEWFWSPWHGRVMRYHCRVPRYYFAIAYAPAFITHRRIIDAELEKQIAELEALIIRKDYYKYSWHAESYKDYWEMPYWHKRKRRKVKMGLTKLKLENLEGKI